MKFVMPTAPMLITVPEMIWSILWRMPEPGEEEAEPPATSIAEAIPMHDGEQVVAGREQTTLATTAATHAPMSILPSRAMFNMPLRSERMPAIAAIVIGAANSRLPAITFVRIAGLPPRRFARTAATHGHDEAARSQRPPRNGGAADQLEDGDERGSRRRRRSTGRRPGSGGPRSRRPAGRSRTRTSASTSRLRLPR